MKLAFYGLIAAAVMAFLLWFSQGRYDSGYRKGKEDTEKAVAIAKAEWEQQRDAEEETRLAETKSEYLVKLTDALEDIRNREKALAERAFANHLREQAAVEQVALERDAVLDELRRTRASREIRAGSCPSPRLPKAAGDIVPPAPPSGLLSERDEADLVRRAVDCDRLNEAYRRLKSDFDSLTAELRAINQARKGVTK